MLADLRDVAMAEEISDDLINIAVAKHDLYIDLATYRLSEPWRTPVFHTRPLTHASSQSKDQSSELVAESKDRVPQITSEGQVLMDQSSDFDLATALFRNRVIHTEQYDDEDQERTTKEWAAVQNGPSNIGNNGIVRLSSSMGVALSAGPSLASGRNFFSSERRSYIRQTIVGSCGKPLSKKSYRP